MSTLLNKDLIKSYFPQLNDQKSKEYIDFEFYFNDFYNFCFELPLDNIIEEIINFKN